MGVAGDVGIDGDQWAQCVQQRGWLWNGAVQGAGWTLILAHGAGAPMDSQWMAEMAERLAVRGVNVLRFEFPYMVQRRRDGGKRPPNPQPVLLECWREVFSEVRRHVAGSIAIGGKSMGGRMASLLADELGADALVCLGYPFYAAGKPEKPRVAHLAHVKTPTLIVQGERDALGNREAVEAYTLSPAIEVHWLVAGDHDLKPLKASGYSHAQHLEAAADRIVSGLKPA
ncbi:alpha/beta hydrolase [Pseudomonas lundensis]|uniref:alpha/beta family hydrolase n=1 Tax=Pseudomonas lundensis TaxID=86185 RepID=UPI000641BE8B|nr:alpha/beta family hydrolase [Pseudomonas lundensis]AOZ11484.1 alpha/beta hydrolase [Pseudomonas lundensis]QVQ77446.1 dienelactone hydrolase family protein [Pseudomonas lundensis]QVQ83485.1 dienelactone hydrolase family protein [Pseudomonas lundensis]